jgi:hypothetical protein
MNQPQPHEACPVCNHKAEAVTIWKRDSKHCWLVCNGCRLRWLESASFGHRPGVADLSDEELTDLRNEAIERLSPLTLICQG